MGQGQWEQIHAKDAEEVREEGWGKHKCGLNTSDWEVKREFSRREGLRKLMKKT